MKDMCHSVVDKIDNLLRFSKLNLSNVIVYPIVQEPS